MKILSKSRRYSQAYGSEEEVDCIAYSDMVGRLHDVDQHTWTASWKPGLEIWESGDPIKEKVECELNDTEGIVWLMKDQSHLHERLNYLDGYSELVVATGGGADAIKELAYLVRNLPGDAGDRIFAAVASIAKWMQSSIGFGPAGKETVLDSFRGRVEKIDEAVAYVKFVDSNGAISYAQVEAADLAKEGISEGDAFLCEIKTRDDETLMVISPLPKSALSPAMYAEIDRKLDEALPDSLFDLHAK
jgi:hypothetical protein